MVGDFLNQIAILFVLLHIIKIMVIAVNAKQIVLSAKDLLIAHNV